MINNQIKTIFENVTPLFVLISSWADFWSTPRIDIFEGSMHFLMTIISLICRSTPQKCIFIKNLITIALHWYTIFHGLERSKLVKRAMLGPEFAL